MLKRSLLLSCIFSAPGLAMAQPVVMTDIAPVQSIVANILGTEPDVLIEPGADPHHFALRPSQMRALNEADVIVWMGPAMSPWLADALDALDSDPEIITLLELSGVEMDDDGHDHHNHEEHAHGAHDHDHDHHNHEEHAHGSHDHGDDHHNHEEHAHGEHSHDHDHHDHEEHAHGAHDHDHDHHNHEEHAHGAHDHDHDHHDHGHHHHDHDHLADAHLWFDLEETKSWLAPIAFQLAELDDENRSSYITNAARYAQTLGLLETELKGVLAPYEGAAIAVLHDAYDPFVGQFGLSVAASLRPGDNSAASAARLRAAEEEIGVQTVTCVFSEPGHNPELVENMAADLGLRVGSLDPLGVDQAQDADLYVNSMRAMATAIAECLSASND